MNTLEKLIELLVLENFTPENEISVYFDMDGVLCSFDQRVEEDSRLIRARAELAQWLKQKPEMAKLHKDELKGLLRGPQQDPYMKKLKKLFHSASELVYMIADKPGFFLSLDIMPGAKDMLADASALTGKLPNILTAPMESAKNCKEEKQAWCEKNIPGMYANFFCTQDKHAFAKSKYDILIDDRPKYINKFVASGGTGILHTDPKKTIKELEKTIDLLKSGNAPEQNDRDLEEQNTMASGAVVGYTLPLGMKPNHDMLNVGKDKKDKKKHENRWYDVKRESVLTLAKVFLTEVAKGPTELPDGVSIVVEKSFTDEIAVKFNKNDKGISGSITIKQPIHSGECLNAYIVTDSQATKGYGPLLYDIAIELAGQHGVTPDRMSVSKSASNVWEYYYTNRSDIVKKPLDDRDNPKTPQKEDDCDFHASRAVGSISFTADSSEIKRPWLNFVYYANGSQIINKLKELNKIVIDI